MSDSISAIATGSTQTKHHGGSYVTREDTADAKALAATDPTFAQQLQAGKADGESAASVYLNYQMQKADGTLSTGSTNPTQVASADPTGAAAGIATNTLGSLAPTSQPST